MQHLHALKNCNKRYISFSTVSVNCSYVACFECIVLSHELETEKKSWVSLKMLEMMTVHVVKKADEGLFSEVPPALASTCVKHWRQKIWMFDDNISRGDSAFSN